MDNSISNLDLQFIDFTNASEDEIEVLQKLIKPDGDVSRVEFPWKVQSSKATEVVQKQDLPTYCENESVCTDNSLNSTAETSDISVSSPVQEETLVYSSPPPLQVVSPIAHNHNLLTVGAFVPPPGVTLPAVTNVNPLPNPQAYFIQRTLPYLRTYPHLGVPLFTCAVPDNGGEMTEVAPVQLPYSHIVPIPAAVHALDKSIDGKGESLPETKQKTRSPTDRQHNRRNKKKYLSNNYYNPDMGSAIDSYHHRVLMPDDISIPLQTSLDVSTDHLATVATSIPLVPFSVPPSTFAVANGTIPMPGYPPGLHTLPYSHISGAQTMSAPVFYVPVFNHPYASYMPQPTSNSVVMPMGEMPISVNGCEYVREEQTSQCTENSLISSESVTAAEFVPPNFTHPDLKTESGSYRKNCVETGDTIQWNCDASGSESPNKISEMQTTGDKTVIVSGNGCNKVDAIVDSVSKVNLKDEESCPEQKVSKNALNDNSFTSASSLWADLFKKQCASTELNGYEPQTDEDFSVDEQISSKEINNGDSHNVPPTCPEDIF